MSWQVLDREPSRVFIGQYSTAPRRANENQVIWFGHFRPKVADERVGNFASIMRTSAFSSSYSTTLVIKSSKIESRVQLALQAYSQNQFPSVYAAAKAFDVPYETLRRRYHGQLSRAEMTPNSRKVTRNEEELVLQGVLSQSARGHPP